MSFYIRDLLAIDTFSKTAIFLFPKIDFSNLDLTGTEADLLAEAIRSTR